MSSYDPHAGCTGAPGPSLVDSCYSITSRMPAARPSQRTFGTSDEVDADVEVLVSFPSDDDRCTITVASAGAKDTVSWYEIWEAATAVNAVCGEKGQSGTAYNLGTFSRALSTIECSFL